MSTALTAKAPMAGLAALSLSFLLHLGGGLRLALPDPQVEIAGGAPTTIARLGNSFRDVAQGSTQSAPPTPLQQVTPEKTQQVPHQPPLQTTTTALVEQVQRTKVAQPAPSQQPPPPLPLLSPSKTATITAPSPTPTTTQPPTTTALTPVAIETVPPTQVEQPLTATPPTTRIAALPEPKPAPKPTPAPPKPQTQAQNPPSAQGAERAERQGSADGQRAASANAAAKQPAAKAAASGNAELTNYAGKVWRKIQRARPNSSLKGTTVIAIAISDRGRLTSVSVARSSGSAQLDQLALRAARKAAPFPAPPDRKAHRFTFKVRGQ
ncbi:TonB C-terminal domain-containing protein [Epibacterium ulvae]|uniref:energy transducer TonB family protein n=1 Tax=Epibacterium ulvae TaxID=1156985 RepID=UPI001BFC7331|nr:energy transducer TonB [Epibacterium ulvae]MBT8155632.1 TonB C-terminal domain-containing protein [Epibacterium ulvae]